MIDKEISKILIVDDAPVNIIALAQILKPLYDVVVAKDGKSALEAADKHMPNIILLDIMMPDMNGFEVLSKLKSSEKTRGIPVIFITGLNNIEDEEKGFSLGAVDYITKPFHDSIVKARIKTHLKMAEYINTIERISMIDTLTNLSNRYGFDIRLKAEWIRCAKEDTPLGVLMLDVDKFKVYNDTYGHPQGDIQLQSIARIISNSLKNPMDFAARWGGEEFVVLLPNADLRGTIDVAESIREKAEKSVVPLANGIATYITVSIGACSEIPCESKPKDFFVSMADTALYQAKSSGRNMVCTQYEA